MRYCHHLLLLLLQRMECLRLILSIAAAVTRTEAFSLVPATTSSPFSSSSSSSRRNSRKGTASTTVATTSTTTSTVGVVVFGRSRSNDYYYYNDNDDNDDNGKNENHSNDGDGDGDGDGDDDDGWTMEEDWALLDAVPKFTAGDGAHARTFWTQLSACTPALASKANAHDDDLFRRCEQLVTKHGGGGCGAGSGTSSSSSPSSSSLVFGPSPPVLNHWQIDFNTRYGEVVGQTDSGRTIWLRYQCIGRLQGDPFSDLSPSVLSIIPGGYLEAVGGRVYELGEARWDSTTRQQQQQRERQRQQQQLQQWGLDGGGSSSGSMIGSFAAAAGGGGGGVGRRRQQQQHSPWETTERDDGGAMSWWVPATTGTVSAMLASTVLSACIGYGAGLGIIADESGPHHHHQQQQRAVTAAASSIATGTTTTAATAAATTSVPTLAEQRVRAEYKVQREQRLVSRMLEKLDTDQRELELLKLQEQQQQQQQQQQQRPPSPPESSSNNNAGGTRLLP